MFKRLSDFFHFPASRYSLQISLDQDYSSNFIINLPNMSQEVTFRFYKELNDYLPTEQKKIPIYVQVKDLTSVQDVLDSFKPLTIKHLDTIFQCTDCNYIYWEGSHFERMSEWIDQFNE